MYCENILCIYQKNMHCSLNKILINAFGMCDDCILIDVNNVVLQNIKDKMIDEFKNRIKNIEEREFAKESSMNIKVAGLTPQSIVDGKGLRYTVFTQGCPHHCKGCHNPQSWAMDAGEVKDIKDIFNEFLKNPILKGMTFSGGEPFVQPKPLIELAKLVKSVNKDITIYSGYTYEELIAMENEDIQELISLADVLIDGKFIEEEKNLELLFRGSENQRLIDLNKTRENKELTFIE